MPIITLTTDMGTSGYYAGSVKAAILTRLPAAVIVDITHHIKPFHISSAAFIVRNVYNQFPAGSVHIVSVDSLAGRNPRFLPLNQAGTILLALTMDSLALLSISNHLRFSK